jgi:hypothetical protein
MKSTRRSTIYNIERFCDLLDEMRKRADTKFVAITLKPHHHGPHGPALRGDDGREGG